MSAFLRISNVSFEYGTDVKILDNFSLEVQHAEIVALCGPSGCGKTTLFRIIAGLELPRAGVVSLGSVQHNRNSTRVGYMMQSAEAFPWMTVTQNCRWSRPTEAVLGSEIATMLKRVGLQGAERLYPRELSGGMRKRLALGRLLLQDPEVVLLDEPFASLDESAKGSLVELMKNVIHDTGKTAMLITHDPGEAATLATRVINVVGPPLRIIGSIAP